MHTSKKCSAQTVCSIFSVAKALKSSLQFKRLLGEMASVSRQRIARQLVPLAVLLDTPDLSEVRLD